MSRPTRFRDQIVNLLVYAKEPPDRYELPRSTRPVLVRALAACLGGANAAEELSSVIALVIALETELESPRAAAELRALLSAEPRAVRVLHERWAVRDALDETRRFQLREGRAIAPGVARAASTSGLKLQDMIDPCSRTRTRSSPR